MHLRRILLQLALLVLLSSPVLAGSEKIPSDYRDLHFPTLNTLTIPQPQRMVLANGMVIFLLEDHELPMIHASTMLRVGWRWEPVAKAGLAELMGRVMRTGGTLQQTGDHLDEALDRLGASVETSVGRTSGSASVSVLKEDATQGLTILAEVLRHPAFPPEKIELAKIELRNAISRRNDDMDAIAFRETRRLLYGPDSAYGHQPEYATLASITREDVIAFHQAFIQPENIILAVWGDFRQAEMRQLLEKLFAPWPAGRHPQPTVPTVNTLQPKTGIYTIDKDDINQSWVLLSRLAGRLDDPDYYALSVMNHILGGGFSSRLFNRVRTKAGLGYEVFSVWSAGWDYPGMFIAGVNTHSHTTLTALQAMNNEIATFVQQGTTEVELTEAKDAILKSFAFEFDSTAKIIQRLMAYEYYGYPKDYLQHYRDNVQKVTRLDIQQAAQNKLQVNTFTTFILGNPKDYEKPLSSLGQVTPLDIRIPQERDLRKKH